jgi:uncharacterized protein (DUF697 family)
MDLQARRNTCEKKIGYYAKLAAANGFLPIPGLSFFGDLAIQIRMNRWILKCYGLTQKDLDNHIAKAKPGTQKALKALAKRALQFGNRRYVTALFRRQLGKLLGKETAKWLPAVGWVISSAMGYTLTKWMGNETMNACEEICKEMKVLESQGPS